MGYEVKCSACGKSETNLLQYKCSSCGQPLNAEIRMGFDTKQIQKKRYDAWRYARFFPYVRESEIVTLGEGWTPLVGFSDNVYLKLESLNPTGSFKDRGSTTLISSINQLVKNEQGFISEDSSGNAGSSIAAYAARAGLTARVYVPATVSGPKFSQIQFYGAEVVKVAGSRTSVADEAQKPEKRKFYVGHILHPLFRDGMRSLAYEMAEQFDWHFPDCVFLPVSAGTLLLGVIEGLRHLTTSGMIEHMPRIMACQTSQVSPLYHRFKNLSYTPPTRITSVADALVSIDPPLLDLMVTSLRKVHGDALRVEEDEILDAFRELARKGFFVEPSSAVAYAGYKKSLAQGSMDAEDKTVIVLTGAGLKTTLKP